MNECTCSTFVKNGVRFTELRDPKCPEHGDNPLREQADSTGELTNAELDKAIAEAMGRKETTNG